MFARSHGETPTLEAIDGHSFLKAVDVGGQRDLVLSTSLTAVLNTTVRPFGFMFDALVDDPGNRLPEGVETIKALKALGVAMAVDPSGKESDIPAAYTYFGQFIDHDITKTVFSASVGLPGGLDIIEADNFAPLNPDQIASLISNARTAPLDLDSVYGGLAASDATRPDGSMVLGSCEPVTFGPISTADLDHDLPRRARIQNPSTLEDIERDRQALIGDPRNDENLIVGQLHVAFLRAHNALIKRGLPAADAQTALRRRYQWAVLHDFLPRICEASVIQDILDNGPSVWKPQSADALFMPVEFGGAAYRFGHSMIRQEYDHNATFSPGGPARATFDLLFTFTALSGDINFAPGGPGFATLPNNWIIDWARFFSTGNGVGANPARRIDTQLAPELGKLPDFQGHPIQTLMGQLAARNLLRGYLLGLPTGQAVARALGLETLSPAVVKAAVPDSVRQRFVEAGFDERTPLWFYVLAEAATTDLAGGRNTLGPVGSRIVGETLWNLARHAADSVIVTPPTDAELATGEFTLRGIVKLGLDSRLPPL